MDCNEFVNRNINREITHRITSESKPAMEVAAMYESHIPPINQPTPIPTQPKEQDLDDFIFAQDGAPVSER